jgi:hypothetical protein
LDDNNNLVAGFPFWNGQNMLKIFLFFYFVFQMATLAAAR